MGLTFSSTGKKVSENTVTFGKSEKTVLLAGNPNVGKSTVFNALTGLHQHTGNWSGKTVSGASGTYKYKGTEYSVTDIPGTYSLYATSLEESAARDLILMGRDAVTVVVCDATCLERNLNLVLQITEITPRVIVAVNMMDEAESRGICVNCEMLSKCLGIPVVPLTALKGKGLKLLQDTIASSFDKCPSPKCVIYPPAVESASGAVECFLENIGDLPFTPRWLALRILENDESILRAAGDICEKDFKYYVNRMRENSDEILASYGISPASVRDVIVSSIYNRAEEICSRAVCENCCRSHRQTSADRFLTRRSSGSAVMLLLLVIVFFITIHGANAVSDVLFTLLQGVGDFFSDALLSISAPIWLHDCLIFGLWRVLAWVVSVMLPPMAIFFPLFTLLEDLGYLPRVAFCLDEPFRCCGACGKQALTMCMGFGCNAAGVTGCRIIDSPRERLIAMLTNSFVPCNGRFPILIALISLFFAGNSCGGTIISAIGLTVLVLFGVAMSFLVSKFLSKTVLRGLPSSMTLEMPPFRRPQVGKILIRSLLDRTVFVLGRAISAAAPAGIIIWLTANIPLANGTLLSAVTDFLDPVGTFLGMDGVILTAFILGIPANEIVLPIIIMAYSSQTALTSGADLDWVQSLLIANGWTWRTALCVMVFSLCHWPCATTLMTVKKETSDIKWTAAAFAIPTLVGAIICVAINVISKILVPFFS